MEKKSNKGLYIVIGMLAVLVIVLTIMVVLLFLRGTGEAGTTGTEVAMEVETSEPETRELEIETTGDAVSYFDNEVDDKDSGTITSNAFKVVANGVKMMVPIEYSCYYDDEIGVVIYMSDVFQMKLAVVEKDFNVIKEDPAAVTVKTIEAGGEILQDVKFVDVNGSEYAYFLMNMGGDKLFVGYTKVADQKTLGCQMVIEKDDLTDTDVLNIFASVAATAEETEEPDSTQEDIDQEIQNANFGERKRESFLSFEGETVTFGVPDEFYGQGKESTTSYAYEVFYTLDYVSVDCILRSKNEGIYEDAKTYIAACADFESVGDIAIEETEVDGVTYYYFIEDEEYEGDRIQNIYAACDISENGIYSIEVDARDVDRDINLKTIAEFMSVK